MSFSPKENLLICFNNQILHHAIKLYPERLSDMEKKKTDFEVFKGEQYKLLCYCILK